MNSSGCKSGFSIVIPKWTDRETRAVVVDLNCLPFDCMLFSNKTGPLTFPEKEKWPLFVLFVKNV